MKVLISFNQLIIEGCIQAKKKCYFTIININDGKIKKKCVGSLVVLEDK